MAMHEARLAQWATTDRGHGVMPMPEAKNCVGHGKVPNGSGPKIPKGTQSGEPSGRAATSFPLGQMVDTHHLFSFCTCLFEDDDDEKQSGLTIFKVIASLFLQSLIYRTYSNPYQRAKMQIPERFHRQFARTPDWIR